MRFADCCGLSATVVTGLALQNASAEGKMVHAAKATSISPDEALKNNIAPMKKDKKNVGF